MTVRDMHIEVNQSLQKVAANKTRKFLSGEIDLVLNKMVGRFIKSQLRPRADGSGGFDVDQLGVDALQGLLVSKVLNSYVETDSSVMSFLPSDYQYLIRDTSNVQYLCGKAPVTQDKTLKILTLRQDRSTKNAQNYYLTIDVTLGDVHITVPGSLPYSQKYEGYESKDDIDFLSPYLLQLLRASGVEVYWERFYNLYKPANYFMVGENLPEVGKMIIDGTDVSQFSTLTKTFQQYTGTTRSVANRLCSSQVIDTFRNAAFFKSSAYSPVSELRGNLLIVYHDNSFTVNNTQVTYVRKPQPISLLLGTDCDLKEDLHQAICDLAVEYLKGRLGDVQGSQLAESDYERRVKL